jgi:predicted regulator of amino acid metabolism with ACT domain
MQMELVVQHHASSHTNHSIVMNRSLEQIFTQLKDVKYLMDLSSLSDLVFN